MQEAHATDMDYRVLHAVHKIGTVTFDSLLAALYPCGFAAVFGAVDRLSRCGVLRMVRADREYEISPAVTWGDALAALEDSVVLDKGNDTTNMQILARAVDTKQ